MATVIFTPAAQAELIRAQEWYEGEAQGLGGRFRKAVDVAVSRLSQNPRQFPLIHRNVRRVLLRRFPYALMFVIEPDGGITVLACFHGSRDPVQWRRRI